MKLKRYRVRNFRSIIDSGDIDVDDCVTCLVGKNESGKTAYHKVKQRTIAAAKQMYCEGNSTAAIARLLNTMKIPTKRQGKGWHNYMVIRILERGRVYVANRDAISSVC